MCTVFPNQTKTSNLHVDSVKVDIIFNSFILFDSYYYLPKTQELSMTRKCHNHILQTNQWHREEDLKNDNSNVTFGTQQK